VLGFYLEACSWPTCSKPTAFYSYLILSNLSSSILFLSLFFFSLLGMLGCEFGGTHNGILAPKQPFIAQEVIFSSPKSHRSIGVSQRLSGALY